MGTLKEYKAEQDVITAMCKAGTCEHEDCTDNKCDECGGPNPDGGDGFDGKCADCADKAEPQTYTFLIGMDCRVYGSIDIEATSAEKAAEQLATTESVYDKFEIHSSTSEIDTLNGRAINLISAIDEDGETHEIETELPDDNCGIPYLSLEDAQLIANAMSTLVGDSLEPETAKQAERIMLDLCAQIEHVTKLEAKSGMTCPNCKQTDGMQIVADIWVLATKEGVEDGAPGLPQHGSFWNENNGCRCPICDWSGNVSDAS